MNPKIKNIIILVVVVIALALIYIFFIKKTPTVAPLTSSSGALVAENAATATANQTATVGSDFVSVLLSVKNIKLDDSVFQNPAFLSLKDSSIVLVQDGNEGRPNPFAPIGSEATVAPTNPGLSVDTNLTTTEGSTNSDINASTPTNTPTTTTGTNTITEKAGTNVGAMKKN